MNENINLVEILKDAPKGIKLSTYCKYIWCADLYSHFDEKSNKHFAIGSGHFSDDKILPYEGNEDKIGKPVEIK